MNRLRYLPLATLALLLPQPAFALMVYCGRLPGCGPLKNFVPAALTQVLLRFDVYAYILGTLFIMVGGAYMLLSSFDESYMDKGKNTIIWAVVGIFVGKFAATLVGFIMLEAQSVGGGELVVSSIDTAIGAIFDLMRIALFSVAIYNGMRMVVSRGQEDQFKKSRDGIFWAAVGAIVINLAEYLAAAIRTL